MRGAYHVLGFVALVGGVAGIVVKASGAGIPDAWSHAAAYVYGAVLILSGIILIRGAPERASEPLRAPLPEPGPEVEAFLRGGDKIGAIRRYRELHGCGLKDAKEAVDALHARIP